MLITPEFVILAVVILVDKIFDNVEFVVCRLLVLIILEFVILAVVIFV